MEWKGRDHVGHHEVIAVDCEVAGGEERGILGNDK